MADFDQGGRKQLAQNQQSLKCQNYQEEDWIPLCHDEERRGYDSGQAPAVFVVDSISPNIEKILSQNVRHNELSTNFTSFYMLYITWGSENFIPGDEASPAKSCSMYSKTR